MLFFPTLAEGFGYPVVEGFKTGLPVLSSDIDVIREVSNGLQEYCVKIFIISVFYFLPL